MEPLGDTPLWQPDRGRIDGAQVTRFLHFVRGSSGAELSDYADLYHWSTGHPRLFWPAVWEFCGIRSSRGWDEVLRHGENMREARWFPGARLNFAENLLRYRDDRVALVFRDEAGFRSQLTYAELYGQVAACAAGLRAVGVEAGDRVAGFMPNRPETVIAMLAATSIGAVWSSCSPDFGANGVLDRFGQIQPKVLVAAAGYVYGGKAVDCLAKLAEVLPGLPESTRVVVMPPPGRDPETVDLSDLPTAMHWDEFLELGLDLEFAQLPFDHPVYILYSSGTTGVPKCIVHGAGGTLIQHLKELVLHTDVDRDDVLFYFTTCGWMMWNWLVSGLAVGATVVLYDGSPFHPGPEALFRMAEQEGVTVFGTSAKYLAAVEKAGIAPGRLFDLSRLRAVLSTGSPLAPESFDFVYRDIGENLQLSSISGGTDIISCFALGSPVLPVYRGELQCRGLGMAVDVYDDDGRPVRETKGELVCTAPFPSMPVGFWNDPDGHRYRKAYFERFDNVWCHGDYAELTHHEGMVIHGRSDAVLNPGGVRIGTAEIYRQVERLDEVLESLAIGQEWEGDERIVLFVRVREGVDLDAALQDRIRGTIRQHTSPRHVPAKIVAVADIPRTISGKIVELAVREAVHGRPVTNTDALANPEALDGFRNLPALAED